MKATLITAALGAALAFVAGPVVAGIVHDGTVSFGYVDLPDPGARAANCLPWQAEPAVKNTRMRRPHARLEHAKLDHSGAVNPHRTNAASGSN